MIRRQSIYLLKAACGSIQRYKSINPSVATSRGRWLSSDPSTPASTTNSPNDDDAPNLDAPDQPDITPFTPYIPLYHHNDPSLFPILIPGSLPYITHNLFAAFNAMVTLLSSQEARDKFVSIANLNDTNLDSTADDDKLHGSIIDTNVLGQADMGVVKVLALFDGLYSPLYKGTQFNVEDFMNGAGFALQRFQHVGRQHMRSLTEMVKAAGDEQIEYDFLDLAKSNPDSLEHDLMKMTTPAYWDGFNQTLKALVGAPSFLLDVLKQDEAPDTKITHLALLSARVASVDKPVTLNPAEDDPNAPLEDDSLKPHVERQYSKPQIVTQLEVLFESEVTLPEIDKNGNKRADGQKSKMTVDVATFEACISGDPNGDMRWRLCQTRPALEFGYSVSPMMNSTSKMP